MGRIRHFLTCVLCPLKTGPFEAGVVGYISLAGRGVETTKASRFSDAQKAFVLKQSEERTPVAEICRKTGISQATYFSRRKKSAGLLSDEMRRLKALGDENGRLKWIVTDLTLDREMLLDVIRRKI